MACTQVLRVFCAAAVAAGLACRPAAERRPDVIIYLVDTLRADHLGCYGYPLETSPWIDAFAAESVLFEEAVAQSAWTRPAVTSILTGLDPHSHGVEERLDALPESFDTLPEILRREGYQTAAFVSSAVITAKFGFGRGFDTFRQRVKETIEPQRTTSEWVNAETLRWLERRDPDRPFFLFLHTLDPHMPYRPPEPFRQRLAPDADPRAGLLENVVALRDIQGRSLLPLLQAPSRRPPAAFSSLDLDGRRIESVILKDRKLIHTLAHDRRPLAWSCTTSSPIPGSGGTSRQPTRPRSAACHRSSSAGRGPERRRKPLRCLWTPSWKRSSGRSAICADPLPLRACGSSDRPSERRGISSASRAGAR